MTGSIELRRRRRVTPLAAALAAFYRDGRPVERFCYLLSGVLVLSGVFHLGMLVFTGDSWAGPVSWRKPMTFGVSFGLTLATITWVTSFVRLGIRERAVLLGAFAAACVVEVGLITLQRWRGLPSHFSSPTAPGAAVNSGLDGVAAAGAAAGAAAIVITTAFITVRSFAANSAAAPSMRLAVQVGFLSLMVALAVGVTMLARGLILSRSGDLAGAFAFAGTLKPAHAATMHGVLVLPALAWLLTFTSRPEHFRLAVVRVGCLCYLLLAVAVAVPGALLG